MIDSLAVSSDTLAAVVSLSDSTIARLVHDLHASQSTSGAQITTWVTLAIAALAVLFGPFIQRRIALAQLSLQANISERQIGTQIGAAETQAHTQLKIAKQQFAASVLSRSRQEWINELRQDVAEFILQVRLELMQEAVTNGHAKLSPYVAAAWGHLGKVELLINVEEHDHVRLVNLMMDALGYLEPTKRKDVSGMTDSLMALIKHTQMVLKREWNRVKAGE